MRLETALICVAALAWAGCANNPNKAQNNFQAPQQTAQAPVQQPAAEAPAEAPASDVVRAPSPFGSREAAPAASDAEPSEASPRERTVVPSGTTVRVRLTHAIDTGTSGAGQHFTATLDTPILDGAHVAIPRGTTFTGHLTSAKSSGRLRGRAVLGLTLDSFELNGKRYEIDTSSVSRASASHKKRNLGLIGGVAGAGALIGALAGGGKGALIGAGAGAAAGTGAAAFTGRKNVHLPVETPLSFTLARSVAL